MSTDHHCRLYIAIAVTDPNNDKSAAASAKTTKETKTPAASNRSCLVNLGGVLYLVSGISPILSVMLDAHMPQEVSVSGWTIIHQSFVRPLLLVCICSPVGRAIPHAGSEIYTFPIVVFLLRKAE